MKILSIDVGIKNLAFCLMEKETSHFKILKWDTVDIADEHSLTCQVKDKNTVCNKPAKFEKESKYFCLKHSKKQCYLIPTADLKYSFLQKQKIQNLYDIADKYNIAYQKPIKKTDLLSLIHEYINKTCFDPIVTTNASKVDLITVGYNIKTKLNDLFHAINIDIVIIENQISPIANRMKTIQGMIAQYFIMRSSQPQKIEFISACNKLKEFTNDSQDSYSERKKLGVSKTADLIQENHPEWYTLFSKSKKKDDLADSFLQGWWFIKNKL